MRWVHRLGFCCPIGLIGVAACIPDYNLIVHSFFAGLVFIMDAAAFVLIWLDDYKRIHCGFNRALVLRLILIIIGLVSLTLTGLFQ